MAKPDEAPAGLPSGNTKYVIVALVLLLGIGGIVVFKFFLQSDQVIVQPSPPPPARTTPVPSTSPSEAEIVHIEVDAGVDAGSQKGPATVAAGGGGIVQTCSGKCEGIAPPELASSLSARAAQARGCYNQALLSDATLKGNMNVAVRVGPTGATCGAPAIVSNQMGGAGGAIVAGCVQRVFSGTYPAPKGGCVDATIPLAFSTR